MQLVPLLLVLAPTLQESSQEADDKSSIPGPAVQVQAEAAPVRSPRPVSPRTLAQDVVREKGWGLGYNPEKKRFIVIGEAPIAETPDSPDWGAARSEAFTLAMLAAKRELATFIRVEISRRTSMDRSKPDSAAAFQAARDRAAKLRAEKVDPNSLSMMDKVAFLAHQEVDKFIDDDKKISEPEQKAIEAVVLKKEFQDLITIASHAETAGLAAYQTFESGNKIAVIAMFTEGATQAMAKAMLGSGVVDRKSTTKSPISTYCSDLDKSGTLAYTHGVRLRVDENGDLNLIAFAHVTPEFDDPEFADTAFSEATDTARGLLRSFAGELVDNSSTLNRASSTEKIADEARKLRTRYSSKSSYDQSVKTVAASLNLPGSTTAFQAEYVHPDAKANGINTPTCVSVVSWSCASAQAAAEFGAIMESLGGSTGGAGFKARLADGETADGGEGKDAKKKGKKGKGGRGQGGDDDDFGGGI